MASRSNWSPRFENVWRGFKGRRGGIVASDVINFITLELGDLEERERVRNILLAEFSERAPMPIIAAAAAAAAPQEQEEPWVPRRLMQPNRILVDTADSPGQVFDPFGGHTTTPFQAHQNRWIPAPVHRPSVEAERQSEMQFNRDVREAIRRSLLPESEIDYDAPTQPMDEDPPELEQISCLICMQETELFRITFCCNHKYCRDCVEQCFKKSESGLPRCPDCVANGLPTVKTIESRGIAPEAHMFMDPCLINQINPGLCHSRHILPFVKNNYAKELTASCPKCDTLTYGYSTNFDRDCRRCSNPKCALLFCRRCASQYHGTDTCPLKIDPADSEYMKKNVRRCPNCNETIQHLRNHGCHHVKCPTCSLQICYACGNARSFCEKERRCPIYCNDRCSCPDCEECKPGKRCSTCTGCQKCKTVA
jgi:hypothetical protein